MSISIESLKAKFDSLLQTLSIKVNGKLGREEAAVSADKLTTPFTLSLIDDVIATVNIDGSSSVALNAVLKTVLSEPGVYGGSVNIPVITVDSKGRITQVTNTPIGAADTSQSGIVKLNSAVDSTSESEAATPAAVKSAHDLAAGAIPMSERAVANGVCELDDDGQVPRERLPVGNMADRDVFISTAYPSGGKDGDIWLQY